MMPLVEIQSASVKINSKLILTDINIDLCKGQITTLIGPNGAGKTTLVRVVLGLLQLTSGTRKAVKDIRIGYMPQKINFQKTMPISVEGFLRFACRDKNKIQAELSRVGVPEISHTPIHSVSGGEMQRVLLARALLRKPHLLVLDEPAQGVDINGQCAIYKLITQIKYETGCAVLMVSHDLNLVMASTDKVICLNQHICCSGAPELVKQHPNYQSLFYNKPSEMVVYKHKHDHHHSLSGNIIKK